MIETVVAALLALAAILGAGHVAFWGVIRRARRRRRRNDELLFAECVSRGMQRTRRVLTFIPGPPRCRICYLPFGGVGKVLFRTAPSRVNPNFCQVCFERLPEGVYPMDVGVLFADVRGFTALAEQLSPDELTRLSKRFFAVATDVLVRHDAIIDSYLGDGILALFLPTIPTLGQRTCDEMVAAAAEIVCALANEHDDRAPLPVGTAVHYGSAMVGNIDRGVIKEFGAVGDVVNTAARLQQRAGAGEVLVSDEVWARLSHVSGTGVHRNLSLRGKSTPVGARRIAAKTLLL